MVLLLLAAVLAAVNVFGSWAVSRRRRLVSWTFLLAAAVLTVTAVAYAYGIPEARLLLTVGAGLTFVASLLNALLVLGKFEPRNHAVRAAALLAIVALAWLTN